MTSAHSLGITGIHHVSLRVADLDRSLTLYRDTLGLVVKTAFVFEGRRFALLDAGNSGFLELVETRDSVHPARADDAIWHFALGTDSLDRTLDAVAKAGYVVTMEKRRLDLVDTVTGRPFSISIAFFRGPDGEAVELLEG